MSPSDRSFTKVGQYGLTFKSFFMWSRIVDRGTPSSDERFRVDFIAERSMEAATAARFQARCFSANPRPVFNTSRSEPSFFPIQQCRSSWWSLIKSFPERSLHLEHGLSRVLSLMHPHTCYQAFLDRVTVCVSHMENTTKFCGCGKSRVHYLAHCYQTTILHCTACCAVLCQLTLSLRCVLSGCTVTSRPSCIYIYIYIYYTFCGSKIVTLTSGISHKNTKYTTERHYKYFIYNIQILYQVH